MENIWKNAESEKPEVKPNDGYSKSKEVLGYYSKSKEYDIVIYETGFEDGEKWESWWCPTFDDIIEITHWCDVLPERPN